MPADLDALLSKYERLVALRVLHDRAKADPTFVEPDPRPEMRAIAARWPGALRELDARPLDELRGRVDAIRAAAADPSRVARWMIAADLFHRHARAALAAKRWLGKDKRVTDVTREAFREAAPDDARAWEHALASIAAPPRGRVMELVLARVADELGVAREEARRLVFGR